MIQNAKTIDMKKATEKAVKAIEDLKIALSRFENVKPKSSKFHK